MYSRLLLIYSLLVLISCGGGNSKPAVKIKTKTRVEKQKKKNQCCLIFFSAGDLNKLDTSRIEILVNKISGIDEVQHFIHENKKEAGFLTREDSAGYEIRAGLGMETHFSTRFLFRVNKQNDELQILEIFSGEMVSIEDWRKVH